MSDEPRWNALLPKHFTIISFVNVGKNEREISLGKSDEARPRLQLLSRERISLILSVTNPDLGFASVKLRFMGI